MKTLPRIVSITRTAATYPSFAPVPNHSGPGSVSSTAAHMIAPKLKNGEVLERVDGAVMERRLVHKRDVPEVEVQRPEGQRDERMGQEAEAPHAGQGQHRPEDRPGETRNEGERCEVAEEDVLDHVDEEELLLAERIDR